MSKCCFKCGAEKPLSEFYKHKQMADGHLNKCKECTKRDASIHRDANIESVRAYDRSRAQKPHRIQLNTKVVREWRKNNPEKYRAQNMLNNAIRDGKIQKHACMVCGDPQSEGHHPDYSKPLSVVWLCAEHHREIHLKYPEDHYAHQVERPELPEWKGNRPH